MYITSLPAHASRTLLNYHSHHTHSLIQSPTPTANTRSSSLSRQTTVIFRLGTPDPNSKLEATVDRNSLMGN